MSGTPKAPEEISLPMSAASPSVTAPPATSLNVPILPRYICAGGADIRLPGWGQSRTGTVANLSLSGCYIKSEFAFTVGDQVELILDVDGMSFRAAGRVVHVPSSEMSAGALRCLETLITELNATRASLIRRAPKLYPLFPASGQLITKTKSPL
jgi:hypothetical protein